MTDHRLTSPRDVFQMLGNMPGLQLLFLGLFAATWLIGGNIVVVRHYRRMGRPASSGFKPFAFPWKDFNRAEGLSLFALAIVALTFGVIALLLSPE